MPTSPSSLSQRLDAAARTTIHTATGASSCTSGGMSGSTASGPRAQASGLGATPCLGRPPAVNAMASRSRPWQAAGVAAGLAWALGAKALTAGAAAAHESPQARQQGQPHAKHRAKPPATLGNTLRNTLGMTLVAIPAGEFQMGNGLDLAAMQQRFPHIEAKRLQDLRDEKPLHRVRITRSFYMGRHEVTVGQFREFLRRSGHVPESVADGTGGYGYNAAYDPAQSRRGDAFEGRDPRYSWQNPGFAQGDQHPVVNITWQDAQALARWLTKVEGRTYRLPTEAEWEYACKAGQDTLYPGSDQPADLQGQANVFDLDSAQHWPAWLAQALPIHDGQAFTAPVGSFKPNAFGLHDMVGNVWEWTADYHADDYYAQSPVDDPKGPNQGSVRVRRGGSWHTWPLYARCSYRNWNAEDTRYTLVGVRLVAEMKPIANRPAR